MTRLAAGSLELALFAVFLVCWLGFFLLALAGYPLAGVLTLGLYPLYGIAAAVGWLLGNVFVHRSRRWASSSRRRLLLVFLLSPGGLFYLLWSLEGTTQRLAVPFAPFYAFAICAIFFLVPVSFRGAYPAGR